MLCTIVAVVNDVLPYPTSTLLTYTRLPTTLITSTPVLIATPAFKLTDGFADPGQWNTWALTPGSSAKGYTPSPIKSQVCPEKVEI